MGTPAVVVVPIADGAVPRTLDLDVVRAHAPGGFADVWARARRLEIELGGARGLWCHFAADLAQTTRLEELVVRSRAKPPTDANGNVYLWAQTLRPVSVAQVAAALSVATLTRLDMSPCDDGAVEGAEGCALVQRALSWRQQTPGVTPLLELRLDTVAHPAAWAIRDPNCMASCHLTALHIPMRLTPLRWGRLLRGCPKLTDIGIACAVRSWMPDQDEWRADGAAVRPWTRVALHGIHHCDDDDDGRLHGALDVFLQPALQSLDIRQEGREELSRPEWWCARSARLPYLVTLRVQGLYFGSMVLGHPDCTALVQHWMTTMPRLRTLEFGDDHGLTLVDGVPVRLSVRLSVIADMMVARWAASGYERCFPPPMMTSAGLDDDERMTIDTVADFTQRLVDAGVLTTVTDIDALDRAWGWNALGWDTFVQRCTDRSRCSTPPRWRAFRLSSRSRRQTLHADTIAALLSIPTLECLRVPLAVAPADLTQRLAAHPRLEWVALPRTDWRNVDVTALAAFLHCKTTRLQCVVVGPIEHLTAAEWLRILRPPLSIASFTFYLPVELAKELAAHVAASSGVNWTFSVSAVAIEDDLDERPIVSVSAYSNPT